MPHTHCSLQACTHSPPTWSPAALTTPSCCLHLHQSGQSCWAQRGPSALSSSTRMLAKAIEHLHHPPGVISPHEQLLGTRKMSMLNNPSQVRKLRHRDARSLNGQTACFLCQKACPLPMPPAALWVRKGMGTIFMLCVASFRNEPWARGQVMNLGTNTGHLGPRKAQKKPSLFFILHGWGAGLIFPSACRDK